MAVIKSVENLNYTFAKCHTFSVRHVGRLLMPCVSVRVLSCPGQCFFLTMHRLSNILHGVKKFLGRRSGQLHDRSSRYLHSCHGMSNHDDKDVDSYLV